MNGRWIIAGGGRDEQHKFMLLSEEEKQMMFGLPRTLEAYNTFWYDQLIGAGCVVRSVVASIQVKDMAGNWMNVFKVIYK